MGRVMILDQLIIQMERWGELQGTYRGEVTFASEKGKVSVKIGQKEAGLILKICSDKVIEAAQDVASAMISPVLLIEAEKNNDS